MHPAAALKDFQYFAPMCPELSGPKHYFLKNLSAFKDFFEMWDNYASREKKRYLEQIFNFAFGMLKSLAHADLSGMSYKIDLKKIYIYIHAHVYILRGETWIAVLYRGRLAERHGRWCLPTIHPPPPKRAHFGWRKCFPLAEYWQSQDSEASLASSGGVTSGLSGS